MQNVQLYEETANVELYLGTVHHFEIELVGSSMVSSPRSSCLQSQSTTHSNSQGLLGVAEHSGG